MSNDWLSLPSGEMVRVSEIAATQDRPPYSVNRHSRESAIVLRNGTEIHTPYGVADLMRLIMAIEQKQKEAQK